jgi:hypothetical protein
MRAIQIKRLVVPCLTVSGTLGFGPCLEHSPVFLDRVRSIKRMILDLGTFEKVKFYKARHLVEMTVARKPDVLECCFGPLGNAETVHCDKHCSGKAAPALGVRYLIGNIGLPIYATQLCDLEIEVFDLSQGPKLAGQ